MLGGPFAWIFCPATSTCSSVASPTYAKPCSSPRSTFSSEAGLRSKLAARSRRPPNLPLRLDFLPRHEHMQLRRLAHVREALELAAEHVFLGSRLALEDRGPLATASQPAPALGFFAPPRAHAAPSPRPRT